MRVTLTFDNGPDPQGTPLVLDALAERGIQAVFFVIGQKATRHPELVARARAAGHLIGNHTWSHAVPFGDVAEDGFAAKEIAQAEEAIGDHAADPPLFRPVGRQPGGIIDEHLFNSEALRALTDGGYTAVLWNVVPGDWQQPDDWTDAALAACRNLDHAVVVVHDGYPAGMRHLSAFLDALLTDGAHFSTEFPRACTPVIAGVAEPSVATLTGSPTSRSKEQQS